MDLKKLSPNTSLFFLLLLVVLLAGCTPQIKNAAEAQKIEPVVKTEFLMGTVVKITIYDEVKEVESIFQKVFDRISEIEDKMTINENTEKSEITQLNNMAGIEYSKLSPETLYVMEKGRYYSEISNGKYDLTIGPLVKLWNIGTDEARLPGEIEIQNTMPLVNYENLILDKDNHRAKLNVPGMIVDVGSIAKGYAADEAAKILEEAGIKHALINLGGNILALNTKPDNTDWKLGLQDPLKLRGEYMGIVMLNDQALVSSGIYERYFELDGERFHHILNPKTGYPEENSILSVSIIAKDSIDADGLSTTIFLLGLEEGMQLIEDLPTTEAIFITSDKMVYHSSGIDENNFKITKEEYQLQGTGVIK
ncbi:FAD:protein FMN transferase [Bacillus sp. B15-48]|uniref:FAD:protein FMN transferase n=1 Tax=Bacillus sp. B15-48 TaxID=1548601 RepID=UPI00193FBAF2|nr:FAD:protein FMN transferase [Bacillus sp. B15-48]MBM4763036.1 FAD:protein FMN transferase [Bacillus sp. B15-48]